MQWVTAIGPGDFAAKELAEDAFLKYGHENITLRGNYVVAAGGDAITPMYALRPLVEHNTADSCAFEMNDRYYKYPGKRQGKVAAAIWPWKCKDALLRYNDVADTKLNQDGMAYDADSGDGTVYEYNYSAYNEGGAMMFCLGEAVHSTYRHNVSDRDRRRAVAFRQPGRFGRGQHILYGAGCALEAQAQPRQDETGEQHRRSGGQQGRLR